VPRRGTLWVGSFIAMSGSSGGCPRSLAFGDRGLKKKPMLFAHPSAASEPHQPGLPNERFLFAAVKEQAPVPETKVPPLIPAIESSDFCESDDRPGTRPSTQEHPKSRLVVPVCHRGGLLSRSVKRFVRNCGVAGSNQALTPVPAPIKTSDLCAKGE
jgi:hypothetical protein